MDDGETVGETLIAQEWDWTETPPSVAVIKTVAVLENIEPVELAQLYEYIDPDSLDAVIASGDDVSISFSAYGYTVKFDDSTVIVCDH